MSLAELSTDPVLSQIAVNAFLDMAWPLLPENALVALSYV